MDVHFDCIHDKNEAKRIWQEMAPQRIICDDWNFRYCFYEPFLYKLFFFTASIEGEVIGLLPLQMNSETQCLEFFAATLMEDNSVFVKPGYEFIIPELYKQIHSPAQLDFIRGEDAFTSQLPVLTYRYFLPLHSFQSLEDYFTKYFDGETRGKMRRKIRHIEKESISIQKNNFSDLESLFLWNRENFGEDSTFYLKGRQESFRNLITLPYQFSMLSFSINGQLQGVSLSCMYKGVYEYINLGVSSQAPKDLRAYIHLKNIEIAIEEKAQIFNAFAFDCGWKELFHLEKLPQHQLLLP